MLLNMQIVNVNLIFGDESFDSSLFFILGN
nr:MAG TPA: hypothetical protein [Caudoviricetes sp.]